jgi:hypothetical protein
MSSQHNNLRTVVRVLALFAAALAFVTTMLVNPTTVAAAPPKPAPTATPATTKWQVLANDGSTITIVEVIYDKANPRGKVTNNQVSYKLYAKCKPIVGIAFCSASAPSEPKKWDVVKTRVEPTYLAGSNVQPGTLSNGIWTVSTY